MEVADYRLSAKVISRSQGRSATAAASYRSASEIADDRTGEIHDYTRKGGVEWTGIAAPENAPAWTQDRSKLWNAVEAAETRRRRHLPIVICSALHPTTTSAPGHDERMRHVDAVLPKPFSRDLLEQVFRDLINRAADAPGKQST